MFDLLQVVLTFHERVAATADVFNQTAAFGDRPDTMAEDTADVTWATPKREFVRFMYTQK
jgi:hypothetical protein